MSGEFYGTEFVVDNLPDKLAIRYKYVRNLMESENSIKRPIKRNDFNAEPNFNQREHSANEMISEK